AVGQEVVQHIVDAIRFFLLAYHDAVSSSIGILDRLHKILISLAWHSPAPPILHDEFLIEVCCGSFGVTSRR
ncbi:MAG: hypothetical protein WA939_15575, partial [Nodosilinea sp.]